MDHEENARLRRLRRKAAGLGWHLRKVPDRSRLREEYGPYLLAHPDTGGIGPHSLSLDDVDAFLAGEALRDHVRIEAG